MLKDSNSKLAIYKNQQFYFQPEINAASLKNIELIQVPTETATFY